MALIPRKTYPELTALTAPVVDGDVLAVYRSPGPLRRTTATIFADYIKAFFSAVSGGTLVGFQQAGTDALLINMQEAVRILYFTPEQFSGTDQQRVQAAYNAAGDYPGSQAFARRVLLSRFYDTTATINIPAYVGTDGIGMGRSGLRPTMSSGPALRARSTEGGIYLSWMRSFTIDCVNLTGSAYALELDSQKIATITQVGFWNCDTTSHATWLKQGIQNLIFDQCHWLNNRLHHRIGEPFTSGSFPTTIMHRGCIWEAGLATGAEAVLIQDACSVTFDQKCVDQANLQTVVFRVASSAAQQTDANHKWLNHYHENNPTGPVPESTWRFEGNASSPLKGCAILGASIHGPADSVSHIYATNTDRLQVKDCTVPTTHAWITSGGNNANNDVDARFVGACAFQNPLYNTTKIAFSDTEVVVYNSGILVPTIVKQATGVYNVNFSRDLKTTASFMSVVAQDAGAEPLLASSYFLDVNTIQVLVYSRNAADAVVPTPNTSGTAIPIPDLAPANATRVYLTVEGTIEAP